jgi:hypothetical protein
MFVVRMSCIIGWIGLPCLFPSTASLLQQPSRCILVWFRPWSMSAPKLYIVLSICLHTQASPLLREILFQFVHQLLCLTIFFHAGNNVKACQSLRR